MFFLQHDTFVFVCKHSNIDGCFIFYLVLKLMFLAQRSSEVWKAFSVYEKCEVTFSKKIVLPYQESFHNDRTWDAILFDHPYVKHKNLHTTTSTVYIDSCCLSHSILEVSVFIPFGGKLTLLSRMITVKCFPCHFLYYYNFGYTSTAISSSENHPYHPATCDAILFLRAWWLPHTPLKKSAGDAKFAISRPTVSKLKISELGWLSRSSNAIRTAILHLCPGLNAFTKITRTAN